MTLRPGLYEQLVDCELDALLRSLPDSGEEAFRERLLGAEAPLLFARYLLPVLRRAVAEIPVEERLLRGRELVNRIVGEISRFHGDPSWDRHALSSPPDLLLEVSGGAGEGVPSFGLPRGKGGSPRPLTGISENTLLTGAPSDPSLASELEKEILTASRIDWMVSFLRWSGLRLLFPALRETVERGVPLRIVTTTYMKATEPRCLDELSSLPNTEIRLSLDEAETRLHAKAYLFHRETGFSTGYIGSSNTSRTAFTTGLEWNVKIAERLSPDLWDKVFASFESIVNRDDLVVYGEETRSMVLARLEGGGGSSGIGLADLAMRPYPFQEEILERLEVERNDRGQFKNLVVAATGTGKTVIAAFDFKRYREANPRARLLFVAHRREILEQSLETFRRVLGEPNFGRILLPESSLLRVDHLFISVQLLASRKILEGIPGEFYDVVVIDEVHHGEAPTYRTILSALAPRILLGLTATPERADGLDILSWFGDRIAAEIRLPEAISRGLLVPFHYFGVSDSVDYRSLRWERGRYNPTELDNLLTGDDIRATLVLRSLQKYLSRPRDVRGLGFCVSVNHARKMAELFSRAGLPSEALHAGSPAATRETVRQRLARGELSFIFTVDLYNEGVDIPEVDTVLFLRPTESLTVFLQQLGRGLRRHPGKELLTILDFIGQSREEYSFSERFRALMGATRQSVAQEIGEGFPHLPSGCAIHLEPVARERVLENIRKALSLRRRGIVARLARWAQEHDRPLTLASFLETTGLSLADLYRKASGGSFSGWSRLKVDAGIAPDFFSADEGVLTQGIARLSHVEGGRYMRFLERVAGGEIPEERDLTKEERCLFLMFHYALWGKENPPLRLGMASLSESAARLWDSPRLCEELREVLALRRQGLARTITPLALPGGAPLDLHGGYLLSEILAAFGLATFSSVKEVREGVRYLPELKTELLFVTLRKSEKDYSPTTLYKDYAVSETLFHWQSQNRTTPESPAGQRYIHHRRMGETILLFVRMEEKGPEMPLGLSSPYLFLGPVSCVRHEGSRPMSLLFKLDHPMPPALFLAGAAAAG
ncbi:MAG: DUF3427 domain-containing protein [Leptospirillia bacterium]